MKDPKPRRRVLVVSGGQQTHDYIASLLPTDEFEPPMLARTGGEARRMLLSETFDILVINAPLPDEFGLDLAQDATEGHTGVLLLTKAEMYEQVAFRAEDAGILTLPKPVPRQTLYTSVRLLAAVSARLARMEKKARTLEEKMMDIRLVNRAKWLLISHLGMNETDAHYYIEKQAMDTRRSRREVAEDIIRTYDS